MGHNPNSNAWKLVIERGSPFFQEGLKVLELGPGKKLQQSLVRKLALERNCNYFHADIRNDYQAVPGFVRMLDEFTIDSQPERFDLAVAFQMLHNVRKPWRWLPEVARVLKVGGHLVVEDSVNEDINRHPVDCGRYFPDGMDGLFDEAGLLVVESHVRLDDGRYIGRRNRIGPDRQANLLTTGKKKAG